MQIETTRKYYLTPVKMAISQGEKKVLERRAQRREPCYTTDGNVKRRSRYRKQYGDFSKN